MSDQYRSIHHSFDVNEAAEYGVEEAILIHHFRHWITLNMRLKRNFHEGTYWTYQTLDEISAHFPYMTKERVFNLIEKLCIGVSRFSKKGKEFEPVLKKGNFNKSRYDRTVWYAFCVPTKWILCSHKMEIGDTQYQDCGNTTPIPDPIPDAKTSNIDTPLPPKGEKCVFASFGSHVKLKKDSYEELCSKNSKEVVDSKIEDINDYIDSKGIKPYKDYAATIRQWLKKESTKGNKTSSQDQKSNKKCSLQELQEICSSKGFEVSVGTFQITVIYPNGQSVSFEKTDDRILEKILFYREL